MKISLYDKNEQKHETEHELQVLRRRGICKKFYDFIAVVCFLWRELKETVVAIKSGWSWFKENCLTRKDAAADM